MQPAFHLIRIIQACALFILLPLSAAWGAEANDPLQKIEHLVVIYQENWSFDGLFGKFPGANGIDRAGAAVRQVDKEGRPLATLPRPVAPYELSRYHCKVMLGRFMALVFCQVAQTWQVLCL